MGRSMMWLVDSVSVAPPVNATAPQEVKDVMDKMLGLVMYISIGMALAMLVAAGVFAWQGNQGHGSGVSPALQSKVIGACIALGIIGGATGIANFFL